MSTSDQYMADGATRPPSSQPAAQAVASPRELVVTVETLEDLFNAPTVNPFVDGDLRAMGEPALERAVREMQANGLWDHGPVSLRVRVSADHLPAAMGAPRVRQAIQRYCAAKISDNEQTIRVMRRRARRGLTLAVVLVLLLALLAYLLLVSVLAQAGTVIQGIVVGSVSVFAWVVLWDTLEAWIFDPLPLRFESRALARLLDADVIVDAVADTPPRA